METNKLDAQNLNAQVCEIWKNDNQISLVHAVIRVAEENDLTFVYAPANSEVEPSVFQKPNGEFISCWTHFPNKFFPDPDFEGVCFQDKLEDAYGDTVIFSTS